MSVASSMMGFREVTSLLGVGKNGLPGLVIKRDGIWIDLFEGDRRKLTPHELAILYDGVDRTEVKYWEVPVLPFPCSLECLSSFLKKRGFDCDEVVLS